MTPDQQIKLQAATDALNTLLLAFGSQARILRFVDGAGNASVEVTVGSTFHTTWIPPSKDKPDGQKTRARR